MSFEQKWRDTPPEDRLKFVADQVFDQSLALIEFKTMLINHEGRLVSIERHKSGNPGNGKPRQGNHPQFLFGIGAGVAAAIAGAVVVLKWLGWLK